MSTSNRQDPSALLIAQLHNDVLFACASTLDIYDEGTRRVLKTTWEYTDRRRSDPVSIQIRKEYHDYMTTQHRDLITQYAKTFCQLWKTWGMESADICFNPDESLRNHS